MPLSRHNLPPSKASPKQTLELLVAFLIFLALISIFALISCSSVVYAKSDVPNMSIEWGGSTPSNAAYLSFGTSEWESFWTQGANNWYYTTTSEIGTLVFEILNDKDDADDLDLYVYDYTATRLLCKSDNGGNADEKCEVQKTSSGSQKFYIKVIPYRIEGAYSSANIKTSKKSCNQQTNYYCSGSVGDVLRKSGTNYDCTTFDDYIDTCDGTRTEWQYYCNGNSEVRKKKITFTEYCSDGYSYCRESSSTQDYHSESCDSTEKCSSGACMPKVCSDYSGNTGQECNYYLDYLTGNTKCLSNNPVDCNQFGNIYCWKDLDTCTSDEYCDDPAGLVGAQCFPFPCTINSVSWDKTSAFIGENVGITVQGEHCKSSDLASFEVHEDKLGWNNPLANNQPPQKYFSNNLAKTAWTAEFDSDNQGSVTEYFVKAITKDDEATTGWFGNLKVSCPDNDGDGYSSYGGVCGLKDCDDNNNNIYPGAAEICDYKDDNCNGQVDEGFNLQTDKNNCGSCGNTCSSGYVCNSGKCKGCGDGICSTEIGENPTTCSNDCYGNLTITQITGAPASVKQGQQVTIQAKVENKGTYSKTLSIETGIVPDSWSGKAFTAQTQEYGIQSAIPIQSCCSANNYYVAKNITLNAGQSEIVTFNLYAPTPSSTDACNGLGSAWSNNHKLIVGLYEKCGSGYKDSKVQDIKVYKTCTSHAECPGEYCDFNSGFPGMCKPKVCVNQCTSSGSYLCSGNEIKQCTDINNDGCLETKSVIYCSGGSICISGQSTCQSAPKTSVQIEYADLSTTVNKQPGDIVKLRLKYAGTESITLSYNTNVFTLFNCSDTFTITSDKECFFEVKGASSSATYNIGINNGKQGKLKIISNPSTIIVTDRKKLLERYGDEDEVDAMLKQAYVTVQQQNGVVYDVEDYLTNTLWTSPSEYEGGSYAV
jgi:hypothetical protein